ncbi:BRO family protein [Microcoleus sp. Z1_C3]|uniref:BRO family protein n=1 Tax=unclassified Microcoleus TaxID=2642155 RepID=UPI002FD6E2E6
MQRLIYHVWLNRESLLRDNRSHAPNEVRNKCLDLSRICIAGVHTMHITEITGKQRLQPMLTVTEPGMYRLLLKSRKPIAKRFKRWVFHEVLPAIRKTGYYSTDRSHDNSEFSELEQSLETAKHEIKQYQAESYKLRRSIERTKFSFNHLVQETTHIFSLLNSL